MDDRLGITFNGIKITTVLCLYNRIPCSKEIHTKVLRGKGIGCMHFNL